MRKMAILLIALMVVSVGFLSGCINNNSESGIETVTISGVGIVQTVNNLEKTIELIVTGIECNITVTKETKLARVVISGMDSIVRVSHSHSFTSDISGIDAQIVYYD